jgi:hypothetical protein
MEGFFQCVQRMVLTPVERSKISKQIEISKLSVGTFRYDMAIQDRTARMPSKLQVKFVSNFQISMSFLSIYLLLNGNIICCLSFPFICCRCLGGKLWQKNPRVAERYTPRSATRVIESPPSPPLAPKLWSVLRAGASRERASSSFGTLPALLGVPHSLGRSQSLRALC